jgi:hypothetical protein
MNCRRCIAMKLLVDNIARQFFKGILQLAERQVERANALNQSG